MFTKNKIKKRIYKTPRHVDNLESSESGPYFLGSGRNLETT